MSEAVETMLTDDAVPVFRALSVDGVRRGIRLEQVYWDLLRDMAEARGIRVNQLIARVARETADGDNLTAALRLAVVRHLRQGARGAAFDLSTKEVVGLVAACPSPALVISADKKIVTYNQAFFSFLQSRLSSVASPVLSKDFRLSFDTPIAALVERLRAHPELPVAVGFMIGADNQAFKGRLNGVLAAVNGQLSILCYIMA